MERYDYLESVTDDVREYFNDNENEYTGMSKEELQERLYDDCWCSDSVTGNGSGSYTFNAWRAEEYVCHNLELLGEALEEFGSECDIVKQGAESCDVTIRCYLLSQAIDAVLEELDNEDYFDASYDIEEEEE